MITILSIDIGLKTLSFCKEQYNIQSIYNIKPPLKSSQYEKHGIATNDMIDYINKVSSFGNVLSLDIYDLGSKLDYFSGKAFNNLISILEEKLKLGFFDNVSNIIIEQQMKTNNIALSLMWYIHCWCNTIFGPFKKLELYPSKNKTRILGAPLKKEIDTTTILGKKSTKTIKITKYERKKWSVTYVKLLLQNRNDTINLDFINKHKKKDDLSDTIVQSLSWVVKHASDYYHKNKK